MKRWVIWVVLLTGCGIGFVRANDSVPAGETLPLGGLWKGKLLVLGGELDLTVSVVPLANGKYFAALDVPAQKVNRMATDITVRGDSVLLHMPAAGSRYAARFDGTKRELVGIWTQGGVKSPLRLRYFPMPSVNGPGTRLAPPYREEEVVFNNAVSRLNFSGSLTVPPGAGPFPAVVLVSDLGAQDRDGTVGDYRMMGALADYLTRRGVVVLRYDDRGVGQSGGSTATATTAMRVSDVQGAINFLRSRLEVNIARIGVVGHGEGANVALLAAGQPLPPAFVVSLAGYGLTGEQTLLHQLVQEQRSQNLAPAVMQAAYERQRTMYDIIRLTNPAQAHSIVSNMLRQDQPSLDPQAAQKAASQLLTPWQRYFLAFDPVEDLNEVRCPVLLLSGTADAVAPVELHLVALEKELKSSNRQTVAKRLPGVNHLFQPAKSEWTLMNGEMRPLFSPLAQETIRQWMVDLGKPSKTLFAK
ncbi:alpha/beta hydrolase [Hymenobacter sp. BT683]|uniref:Alpha/beta hydrolase n=1 Tax=Hymenobacter jeongseonensis TaxID=2791027 RepID=A0ABS0ICI1_9BACT|nr:alpha/beta hydrolase [Hymenobacter jeongseonensis]MBF9236058.1 alpha/beta hydrolase [Hymenobacter jeongseonensis]